MKFDADAFRDLFLETLSRPLPASEAMRLVIDHCRAIAPSTDWSPLLLLPFDDEVADLAKVLTRLLAESPPPETVNGFIFGADELIDGDSSQVALQLVSAERIDADDPGFGLNRYDLRYEPPIAIASDVLNSLHEFAAGLDPELDTLDLEDPWENDDLQSLESPLVADHLLLWSYAALAVAAACERTDPKLWLGQARSRKIYVGHGEDYLRLGMIETLGFKRDPSID